MYLFTSMLIANVQYSRVTFIEDKVFNIFFTYFCHLFWWHGFDFSQFIRKANIISIVVVWWWWWWWRWWRQYFKGLFKRIFYLFFYSFYLFIFSCQLKFLNAAAFLFWVIFYYVVIGIVVVIFYKLTSK